MSRRYTPRGTPDEINSRKQLQFARELTANGGFIERALRECHVGRTWLNNCLAEDEAFAALVQAIRDQNNERIEEEIYRRAVSGNEKPLSYQGKLTGEKVREYSDVLLMFYAKANMPGKYRDLPQGKASELTDEELNDRITKYMARRAAQDKSVDQATEAVN